MILSSPVVCEQFITHTQITDVLIRYMRCITAVIFLSVWFLRCQRRLSLFIPAGDPTQTEYVSLLN